MTTRAAASRRKLEAKARLYDDLRRGEARAPAEFLVTFDDAGADVGAGAGARRRAGERRHALGLGPGRGRGAPVRRSGAELLDVAATAARRRTAPRTTTTRANARTRPSRASGRRPSTGTRRAI